MVYSMESISIVIPFLKSAVVAIVLISQVNAARSNTYFSTAAVVFRYRLRVPDFE